MGTTVLITKENKRSHHGTGFVIFNDDENGSFIVTCRHVLEVCLGREKDNKTKRFQTIIEDTTRNSWKKIVLVDGQYAELIAFGLDEKDLAVIYVKNLKESIPFKLCINSLIVDSEISFQSEGFDSNELKSLKDIQGLIIKKVSRGLTHFRLKINMNSSPIEGGNSGSAIVLPKNNQVIGVLVSEENDEGIGFAVSIEYLKDIWKDMPIEIWVECDNNSSILKNKKNMFISLLKSFGIGIIVFILIIFLSFDEEVKVEPISLLSISTHISLEELADSAYGLADYEKAKEYYEKAIREEPHRGQLYSSLGVTYYHLGAKYDIESLKVSEKAIRKAKKELTVQASSFYNIGRVYERQQNYYEALKNYKKALERREHREYDKKIKSMKEKLKLDI